MLHLLAPKDDFESIIEASNLDVNACNFDNDTPLHIALRNCALLNVKILLKKGANVNVCGAKGQSSNNKTHIISHFSALHIALENAFNAGSPISFIKDLFWMIQAT